MAKLKMHYHLIALVSIFALTVYVWVLVFAI